MSASDRHIGQPIVRFRTTATLRPQRWGAIERLQTLLKKMTVKQKAAGLSEKTYSLMW